MVAGAKAHTSQTPPQRKGRKEASRTVRAHMATWNESSIWRWHYAEYHKLVRHAQLQHLHPSLRLLGIIGVSA
jgi:hypothetical protein